MIQRKVAATASRCQRCCLWGENTAKGNGRFRNQASPPPSHWGVQTLPAIVMRHLLYCIWWRGLRRAPLLRAICCVAFARHCCVAFGGISPFGDFQCALARALKCDGWVHEVAKQFGDRISSTSEVRALLEVQTLLEPTDRITRRDWRQLLVPEQCVGKCGRHQRYRCGP